MLHNGRIYKYIKRLFEWKKKHKKALYKVMSTAYRAVQNGRMTWDDVIYLTGGTN